MKVDVNIEEDKKGDDSIKGLQAAMEIDVNIEDKKDDKFNKDVRDVDGKDKTDDKVNSEKVTSEENQ